MNKDLENWFFPHANRLAKSLGMIEFKGRIPILVEDAWNHQQVKIDTLEKENAALKKTLLSVGDEFMKLKDQYEEFTRVFIKN